MRSSGSSMYMVRIKVEILSSIILGGCTLSMSPLAYPVTLAWLVSYSPSCTLINLLIVP